MVLTLNNQRQEALLLEVRPSCRDPPYTSPSCSSVALRWFLETSRWNFPLCHGNVFVPLENKDPLCCAVLSHSVVSDSVTPWTVAHQAPLSMGILQARILEWVAYPFSRGSSQPRNPDLLQVDSLPAELPGKLKRSLNECEIIWISLVPL